VYRAIININYSPLSEIYMQYVLFIVLYVAIFAHIYAMTITSFIDFVCVCVCVCVCIDFVEVASIRVIGVFLVVKGFEPVWLHVFIFEPGASERVVNFCGFLRALFFLFSSAMV